jgi:quercetin dioxygenase-like cupin family protein
MLATDGRAVIGRLTSSRLRRASYGRARRTLRAMPERPYFDEAGEPSDAPGRFVHVDDLEALTVGPGLEFRPLTTDSVMTNFVTLQPNTPTPTHHHVEQQIAVVLSGELTLTVGDETRVMHRGDCAVIPPNVPHTAASGPEGCEVLDVFSPPRAAIVGLMAS